MDLRTSATAGMPKRVYGDEYEPRASRRIGGYPGGTRAAYPFVPGGTQMSFNYPNPFRFGTRSRRTRRSFMFGRGWRPGPSGYRRSRGLRTYPGSGIETKYYDTSISAVAIPAPPASATWSGLDTVNPTTVLCLNSMSQGTGATNRDGRMITMQSLQINGIVNIPAQADQSAADTVPVIKIWIVLDKQTNGGDATTGVTSENVYTNPTATIIGGLAPLRNMLYSKRYKVLKEIVVEPKTLPMVNDLTNIEQEGVATSFECFINLKGRKVEYKSDAAPSTVADIVDNGLFVMAATSNAATAPTLTYNARLRFRG